MTYLSATSKAIDDLTSALTGVPVIGFPSQANVRLNKPTVVIWQDEIQKLDTFGLERLAVTLNVWLAISIEDLNAAEAVLDPVLMDLFEALQGMDWLDWTTAKWGALPDVGGVGYLITARAIININET